MMSLTLNVTPFLVTGFLGSGSRIAAGTHAWQMPHQVGMQRPFAAPGRLAHSEPSLRSSHSVVAVHSLREVWESMPFERETASSTPEPPKAFSYFFEGESLVAPAHL